MEFPKVHPAVSPEGYLHGLAYHGPDKPGILKLLFHKGEDSGRLTGGEGGNRSRRQGKRFPLTAGGRRRFYGDEAHGRFRQRGRLYQGLLRFCLQGRRQGDYRGGIGVYIQNAFRYLRPRLRFGYLRFRLGLWVRFGFGVRLKFGFRLRKGRENRIGYYKRGFREEGFGKRGKFTG
jgi:hypothetical protein